jgi:hypothetical protein
MEAARPPPLAAQVVDRLGAHLQLCAELGQGQDTVDERQRRSRGRVSRRFSVFMTVRCPRTPGSGRECPRRGDECGPLEPNVRSKRGVAMLSPWFGMTGISPDLQVRWS